MTELLELSNQNFLKGLQNLAAKQEGGSASLLKISEIEASNNTLRLKQQTLTATLQSLEAENDTHQTAINTMREAINTEKVRAIAQKLTNTPAPAPTAATSKYNPIPKKAEFRNSRFDREEGSTPDALNGRVPMPSENVIQTALENARRRSQVTNPCEAFQHGNCTAGDYCLNSHDVIPYPFCHASNNTGRCTKSECRYNHQLYEYKPPSAVAAAHVECMRRRITTNSYSNAAYGNKRSAPESSGQDAPPAQQQRRTDSPPRSSRPTDLTSTPTAPQAVSRPPPAKEEPSSNYRPANSYAPPNHTFGLPRGLPRSSFGGHVVGGRGFIGQGTMGGGGGRGRGGSGGRGGMNAHGFSSYAGVPHSMNGGRNGTGGRGGGGRGTGGRDGGGRNGGGRYGSAGGGRGGGRGGFNGYGGYGGGYGGYGGGYGGGYEGGHAPYGPYGEGYDGYDGYGEFKTPYDGYGYGYEGMYPPAGGMYSYPPRGMYPPRGYPPPGMYPFAPPGDGGFGYEKGPDYGPGTGPGHGSGASASNPALNEDRDGNYAAAHLADRRAVQASAPDPTAAPNGQEQRGYGYGQGAPAYGAATNRPAEATPRSAVTNTPGNAGAEGSRAPAQQPQQAGYAAAVAYDNIARGIQPTNPAGAWRPPPKFDPPTYAYTKR